MQECTQNDYHIHMGVVCFIRNAEDLVLVLFALRFSSRLPRASRLYIVYLVFNDVPAVIHYLHMFSEWLWAGLALTTAARKPAKPQKWERTFTSAEAQT